jgi:hypothetical protein
LFYCFSVVVSALDTRFYKCIIVYIARIAILDTVINLSISRRHYNSYVLSNAKKIGGVVDLSALAICESVFFWYLRARHEVHGHVRRRGKSY